MTLRHADIPLLGVLVKHASSNFENYPLLQKEHGEMMRRAPRVAGALGAAAGIAGAIARHRSGGSLKSTMGVGLGVGAATAGLAHLGLTKAPAYDHRSGKKMTQGEAKVLMDAHLHLHGGKRLRLRPATAQQRHHERQLGEQSVQYARAKGLL